MDGDRSGVNVSLIPGENISGALMRVLLTLNLSTLLFFLPYGALERLWLGRPVPVDWLLLGGSTTIICGTFVAVLIRRHIGRRDNADLFASASLVDVSKVAPECHILKQVSDLLGAERISVRVHGDPRTVQDPGGKVMVSPRVVETSEGSRTIVVPALSWVRLRGQPAALAAVLAHEIAHIGRSDLQQLGNIARFQRVAIFVAVVMLLLTLGVSMEADLRSSAGVVDTIMASLAGKSSYLGALALVLVGAATTRLTEICREVLADEFAGSVAGDDALRSAIAILDGQPNSSVTSNFRNNIVQDRGAALNWRVVFLLGISSGALANYIGTPFAYVCQAAERSQACTYSSTMFASLAMLSLFTGAYPICLTIARLNPGLPIRSSRFSSVLVPFVVGAVLGTLATQTLPLMMSALPVFDRLQNIFRHDALPLLLSSIASNAVDAVSVTLVSAVAARAAVATRLPMTCAVGTGAILVYGFVESAIYPTITKGLAYPALLASAVMAAVLAMRLLPSAAASDRRYSGPFRVAVVIYLAGWFGLGSPSTLAVAWSRVGEAEVELGHKADGLRWIEAAANISPLRPDGWARAARIACSDDPGSLRAIDLARRAVDAPFAHGWNDKFAARVLAAACLLDGPGNERSVLDEADEHLAVARSLWARNRRLSEALGSAAMFYSAVAVARRSGSHLDMAVYLAGAVMMFPSAATEMVDRPEMVELSVRTRPRPTSATRTRIRDIHGTTPSDFAIAAIEAGVSEEEVVRVLCQFIRDREAKQPR